MRVVADYVLVGGGLQNGLVALAVRARQPSARIVMIDRGPRPGGNHTWCFHAADVDAGMQWIDPVVVTRWAGYDVAFPDLRRGLDAPYACVTSERLAEHVLGAVDQYVCATASEVGEHRVVAGDTIIDGTVVIDARGPEHGAPIARGWQIDATADALVALVGQVGRARIRAALETALAELASEVGQSTTIDMIGAELSRMENSYG